MGPDDAEQSGDVLNMMVRTGGIGVDDMAVTSQALELKTTPDSKLSLIDWRAIDQANATVKAERQFLSTSGARQLELGNSTQRTVARQIDIIKRNLGLARENGNKAAIKVYNKELSEAKVFAKVLKDKGLSKASKKYDDIWLPPAQKGIMQDPARYNKWLAVAGDRAMRSLYPGGLGLNQLADTRAGQIFAPLREPQRFFDQYSPGSWDRIRSSYLRYHRESRAFYDDVVEQGLDAGLLIPKTGKFDPSKDFSPFTIDKVKNELLFDLLDTHVGTPEFAEFAKFADPKLMKMHDHIRKVMDHASDLQGLSDTPKHLLGYMRHVFDRSQFAGGARPLEYIGLPAQAEVFASHLLTRTGNQVHSRDAMLVLDLYGRAMNRKLIIEPMYDDIIRTGSEMMKKHNNPMFQTYANDFVAQLRGTPSSWGLRIDETIGGALNSKGVTMWTPGALDRALIGLSGAMWAGALPGNPRYPLMQIATGIATTSSRFGLFRTSKALWQMGTKEGQAINKEIGTYDQFLSIFETQFGRKWSEFMTKRAYLITPVGPISIAQTEEFIRGTTALAAVDMHMTKLGIATWAEARELGLANRIAFEALRSSEEVNHMFGALGRAPWAGRTISNGAAVSATQFLSFIPKQTEELVSQFNRDPGLIAKYLGISGWMSRIAAQEMGIDITNYVGLGYLPEGGDELTSPTFDVFLRSLDFLYEATPAGTKQGRADATVKLLDGLDGMIPMIVAFEAAGKASERVLTGKHITRRGDLARTLEFGEFKEGNRSADAFARGIDPAQTGEVSSLPGVGGDLLPSVLGLQSIRDNLFRRGQQAARRENERFLADMFRTVRDFANAIDEGNIAAADELEKTLLNDFGQVLISDGAMERAIEAKEIAYTIRMLQQQPKQVQARMIKIIKQFGLPLSN